MKQWVKETMTERVIRQLAKKFHWFDPVVTTAEYLSIHYEKDLPRGGHGEKTPPRLLRFGRSASQAMADGGARSSQYMKMRHST